jgi:hypothetical protein
VLHGNLLPPAGFKTEGGSKFPRNVGTCFHFVPEDSTLENIVMFIVFKSSI